MEYKIIFTVLAIFLVIVTALLVVKIIKSYKRKNTNENVIQEGEDETAYSDRS